ncbi:hypothetical protein EU510_10275 [Pseudoalteromonas sp. FUC4]|uniref:glycosyltransferase family 52 n=1 Tax=Pseudoalteromonas sp. FUC4 TaxID=2511201 RepID=UPI0011F0D83A|nr:glycosyltransferase family 52 [Pseudoalteromonas sp. FUC4]KAA1152447.1 hypothetical protein EU510_10275 [Pseudoalteromonas sp. FUC4]
MKKRAVVENTCYSLLLYFLYDRDWKSKDYFIFGNRISSKYINKMREKVSHFDILESFMFSYKNHSFKFFSEKRKEYLKFKKYTEFYGNVCTNLYLPFRKINRFEIEDGLGTYKHLQGNNSLKQSISDFLNLKRGFLKNKVKKYILTMSDDIPKRYLKDVVEINIHDKWQNLSQPERDDILDVFCIDIEYLNKLNAKKILILTQCFSEDGFISESEKIAIYESIVSKYNEDDILIKTHPREKTNYKNIFPNISVIDDPFPFELISLHGIKFRKAVTLTSTSVFSFNYDLDVDYLGTEPFPKLAEKTYFIKSKFKKNKL